MDSFYFFHEELIMKGIGATGFDELGKGMRWSLELESKHQGSMAGLMGNMDVYLKFVVMK